MATIKNIERPVFIAGAPRSDSASLFNTLSRAKSIHTAGTRDLRQVLTTIAALHPSARGWESDRLTAAHATPQVRHAIVAALYRELRDRDGKQAEGSVRFLDRTPVNALSIPFLHALFPEATFVYVYRDPEATMRAMIEAWRSQRFVTYPKLPAWSGPPWSLVLTPGWRELAGKEVAEIVAAQWRAATTILLDDLEQMPPDRWCVTSAARLGGLLEEGAA